ncbi:MAG: hypothetical protein AAB955_03800 [Patescibacteria group bacterium]
MRILDLFRNANSLSEDALIAVVASAELDTEEKAALLDSIQGDNRKMNKWLFSLPADYAKEIHWMVPVKWEGKRMFAWMIGRQSDKTSKVRDLFDLAAKGCEADPLLIQKSVPLPLLFIWPREVTKFDGWEYRKDTDKNEFAIFQTGYDAVVEEYTDFDQRMALNMQYLTDFRLAALKRLELLTGPQQYIDSLRSDIDFFAMLHTEGHNRAHFVGPWPLDSEKVCIAHELVEECRSCLGAIAMAEHMPLTEEQRDNLAVSIFTTRFFGYAYGAYKTEKKLREEVRETMVGLMFFMRGIESGAVSWDGKTLKIDPRKLRKALLAMLKEQHEAEARIKPSIPDLKELGLKWTRRIFPHSRYPDAVMQVYDALDRPLQPGMHY